MQAEAGDALPGVPPAVSITFPITFSSTNVLNWYACWDERVPKSVWHNYWQELAARDRFAARCNRTGS